MNHTSHPTDLIVVGGGMAGLTAGAVVARAGRSVVLLEQASHLGGRAATHVRNRAHLNLGAHALYRHGHAFRLLRDLRVPFSGAIPNGGRALAFAHDIPHPLPTGFGSLLTSRLFTLREKWKLARFLGSLQKFDARPFDRMPVAEWIKQTAGTGGLALLLRGLLRLTTYADDAERMSAGAAIDQLRLSFAGNVWYIDGGWQSMIDGLRARATEHGALVRTGATAETVDADDEGVTVRLGGGETIRGRAAVLAVGPKAACKLLDLPADAPLPRWAADAVPLKAACLDVVLDKLPRPDQRFALGLDRPLYFSVHSAAAKLAPDGVAVLHLMKYLKGDDTTPAKVLEAELETFLDRLQPGWQAFVRTRRFLPGMTVANDFPTAESGGLSGRPGVSVPDRPNVFLAGDWVGHRGMLVDASAASAEECAVNVLASSPRVRSLTHAAA
jgi:phytoene dehydrogenase-like protein